MLSRTDFLLLFCFVLFQNIGASDSALVTACAPLSSTQSSNGTLSLNPCGLIANSFFTGANDCQVSFFRIFR